MPGREFNTLHSALQQGWETTWGGPTLQVRKTVEEDLFDFI